MVIKKFKVILKYEPSVKTVQYRPLSLNQTSITLQSGERILGIYGESLPPSILVNEKSVIYPSSVSGFVSGNTIYVGSVDFCAVDH